MSVRFGPPLIAGAVVYGVPGLGVLGSVIRATTATGNHGPGLLYNDWDSSADDAKEFRALVETPPVAGVLNVREDGSFTLTGAPDGAYSLVYRLFVDGVDLGTATASFNLGAPVLFAITDAGGIPSTSAVGTPVVTFEFPALIFSVTGAGGIPSTSAVGEPVVSFNFPAPGFTFSVTGAGAIPSTARVGTPSVNFIMGDEPEEPVTWAEAKLACRIDTDELEPDVLGVISAAREMAEHITGRIYKRRAKRFEQAGWPTTGQTFAVPGPVAAAISYWGAGGWQDLAEGAFEWAPDGSATAIAPPLGANWPELAPRAVGGRVRVDITAGPASRADVPACVKRYILAQVAAWRSNPEAVSTKVISLSPLYDHLLDAERLWL